MFGADVVSPTTQRAPSVSLASDRINPTPRAKSISQPRRRSLFIEQQAASFWNRSPTDEFQNHDAIAGVEQLED
jgi:hypothetical protein